MELSNSEEKVLSIFNFLMKKVGYEDLYRFGREEGKEPYIIYKDGINWILLIKENNHFNFRMFPNLHSLCFDVFTTLNAYSCDYCISNFLPLLREEVTIDELNELFNNKTKRK